MEFLTPVMTTVLVPNIVFFTLGVLRKGEIRMDATMTKAKKP